MEKADRQKEDIQKEDTQKEDIEENVARINMLMLIKYAFSHLSSILFHFFFLNRKFPWLGFLNPPLTERSLKAAASTSYKSRSHLDWKYNEHIQRFLLDHIDMEAEAEQSGMEVKTNFVNIFNQISIFSQI